MGYGDRARYPREVFVRAIELRAASIIVAHNHPSGNLSPSSEDDKLTNRLHEAGEVIGIPVIDSLILAETSFRSAQ